MPLIIGSSLSNAESEILQSDFYIIIWYPEPIFSSETTIDPPFLFTPAGHETKDCRKFARFLQQNNLALTPASTNPTVNVSMTNSPQHASWPMFDSGASNHATSDQASMHNLSEYGGPDEIVLGNGIALPISHIGQASIPTSSRPLTLSNVLLVPRLRNHLISVAKLCKTNNVSVEFFPFHFFVKDLRTGARLMRGVNINDVYYAPPTQPRLQLNSSTKTFNSLLSWHHKLGHPSIKVLKRLLNNLGLDYNNVSNNLFHCDACSLNKSHKLPFGENSFKVSKPLELVYSDVWGPVKISNDGYQYYVIFVDFFSKYIWLYPIKRKSDVSTLFPIFKTLVEKFFKTSLVSLFSDNGGEYIGLIPYLQQHGISHFTTPPHTPEQNGVAERRHRHIVETGLSLLHHAHLPLAFWSHAFQTAVHLINRLPTKILDFKSPFEKLYNTPPTYTKLKSFGCLCFPWLRPYAKSKIHPRSTKCIFLGYSSSKSAYKCYDPVTHRLYHSRHVEFIDHIFPFTINGLPPDPLPIPNTFLHTSTQPPPEPTSSLTAQHPHPSPASSITPQPNPCTTQLTTHSSHPIPQPNHPPPSPPTSVSQPTPAPSPTATIPLSSPSPHVPPDPTQPPPIHSEPITSSSPAPDLVVPVDNDHDNFGAYFP
ncbi:hypothetical protein E3N88_45594 [Mikania micrantha]|uniref:Integrase catalytic domain-containing protein n=1 Tax=Mikania micrantha TaxID=192012 RepID=A0A5N6L8R7_9ASTR|nr:hypothetical protein E3N88_45594 [Mikania micrantha]